MWLYLVRRMVLAIAIVAVAVTLLFTMIHMVPGDPATIMLGPRATPELREALRLRLGLDEPFVVQVGSFFLSVLTGDLGIDIVRDQQIGRAHVRTPVTNAHLVCRLLLEKKNNKIYEETT